MEAIMKHELLQHEFVKILNNFLPSQEDSIVSLSETDCFRMWNILGEELGIDLSIASTEERRLLFGACQNFCVRDFSALLWLVYYGQNFYQ